MAQSKKTPPTVKQAKARLAELEGRVESTRASLVSATTGYKKCRQRRGADAYKRAWWFEAKMKEYEAQLEKLENERLQLEAQLAGGK